MKIENQKSNSNTIPNDADKQQKGVNVPNLRFNDFSNNWNKVQIYDMLSVMYGKDYKGLNSGNIPIYGTGGIIGYVNQFLCDWGCVCIGRKGTINKPIYLDIPFWCVDTLFYTKPHIGYNPKFQFYMFQTIDWDKYNEASGVPSLSSSTICKIKKYVPTIYEQTKIANFLTLIDQRIAAQSKIIEEYKCIEKYIIDCLFNDITDHKLLSVISEISKKNKENTEYEVLSISNKNGFIKQSEQFEDHEVASSNKSNYKIVQHNNFAYNPARINVGSIARLDKFEIGIISPMYICFKSNSNILPEYLELFFSSSTFKTQMLKKLEGSVRQCLSFDALCSIKLHIISINEQFGIIKKLNFLKQKIELESSLLNKYLCQKKYLLANMFI